MNFKNGLTNNLGDICDVVLLLGELDKAELKTREYEALGYMGSYSFCDMVIDFLKEHPEINMTTIQDIDCNYLVIINFIGSSAFHAINLHYEQQFTNHLAFKIY